jgi:putative transposase
VLKQQPHRKRIKHYHEPGDLHELTFSCYARLPLLTNNAWRAALSRTIDGANEAVGGKLAAFVYMPEHVHLLVGGLQAKEDVSALLRQIKQPLSRRVKQDLEQTGSRLLAKLTVRDRPGRTVFHFWQEGPGYDRNLNTMAAVQGSLDYIHQNPVRRGLCQCARDWRWSSARYYESDGQIVDELLPRLTPLPAEFWG